MGEAVCGEWVEDCVVSELRAVRRESFYGCVGHG